jgi:adenosylcobinamide-GDP ribazoletransferase
VRPLRDIAAALSLLTVLPLHESDGARPVRWFPAVGWLYGGVALVLASGAVAVGAADGTVSLLTGVVIVAAWAALSRLFHWDGLADSADGLGARGEVADRLRVMRDSSTGAFGTVAIVLTVLVQTIALAVIVESRSWWALAAAPVLGRFGAAAALIQLRPARPDGLAARYAGAETTVGVLLIVATLVPLLLFPPDHGRFIAALVGVGVSQLVPIGLARRFGGITGDVLGATVLLTETAVLAWCALAGGLA